VIQLVVESHELLYVYPLVEEVFSQAIPNLLPQNSYFQHLVFVIQPVAASLTKKFSDCRPLLAKKSDFTLLLN